MIAAYGKRPYFDVKIRFIGLRPGEKMEEELQKRGVLIVNVAELIEGHEAEIAEVLKEFSLLYLMRLADELGEMTKSSSGNGPFQVLKGLVYEEIARRGGSGGMA